MLDKLNGLTNLATTSVQFAGAIQSVVEYFSRFLGNG